jgi:muconolactone delta-isomerase
MNKFMVELDLPSPLTVEFFSLIPGQHYAVEKLMTAGIILSYTLSADQSKLWIIMTADSETDLIRLLETLPLTKFMKSRTYPLAFHNIGAFRMPQTILN